MKKHTIYLDMDGVLADFNKGVRKHKEIKEAWLNVPKFFADLEPIGKPDETIKELENLGYKVYLLTKVEIRDTKQRQRDKENWVKNHIPNFNLKNLIIVPIEEEKTKYLKSDISVSVLLDDYKENLKEWQNKGGISVKFGNKFKAHRNYNQITNNIKNLIPLLEKLEK